MLGVRQRSCRVSVADWHGVEHTVEVTAGSVYEEWPSHSPFSEETSGLARLELA
jgi:hypothetical protein